MTRNLFVALALSFSLFLSVEVETFRYRVAQRQTLSSDIPRCILPAKAEEKDEEGKERRDFLRWPWVWITTLCCTDRPLLRQTIVDTAALETNYLATSSQKTFSTAWPTPSAKIRTK